MSWRRHYYSRRLAGDRLRRCYDIAPPRVKQYLEAEIAHVLSQIGAEDTVLDLGCGYGRVLERISGLTRMAWGIDTSSESLRLARALRRSAPPPLLLQMDALHLAFPDSCFDAVFCVQNGISAFGVDPYALMKEALRATKSGGKILFSSYAEEFWPDRLTWFRLQAAQGLLGEIDEELTGGGVIVCRDGFRATTFKPNDFIELARRLERRAHIQVVDGSSLFCEIIA